MLVRIDRKADELLDVSGAPFGRGGERWLQTPTDRMRGVVCRIIDRRASGETVDELVLDRRHDELQHSFAFVTVGEVLVGFLAESPVPSHDLRGRPDPLAGHARVLLMHHMSDRPETEAIPAALVAEGRTLQFLVEPAGVDALFPLRCALWSDHQFAAKTGLLDAAVYTSEIESEFGDRRDRTADRRWVPAGLEIGRVAIWGYHENSEVFAVRNFVDPAVEPEALVTVTTWFPDDRARPRESARGVFLRDVDFEPVSMLRYRTPTASGRRLLASSTTRTSRPFPSGAAVVDGFRLIGRIETAGNGFGIVSPFGEPGDRQTFLYMPKNEDRDLIEFEGEVVFRDGDRVRLRVPQRLRLPAGVLFTGGGGPHYPSGLWIGRAVGAPAGYLDIEHRAVRDIDRQARVTIRRHRGGTR